MAKREKTSTQVALAAAVDTLKTLRVQHKQLVAQVKTLRVKVKTERAEAKAVANSKAEARKRELIAKAQARLQKLMSPQTAKRKARKASKVTVLVENGQPVASDKAA